MITLHISSLKYTHEKTELVGRDKKKDHVIHSFPQTHPKCKKERGWKSICHSNANGREAGVAIFISHKVEIRPRKIRSDKEVHSIILKDTILQEDITILNMYAPKNTVSKYPRKAQMRQTLYYSGVFNTTLSVIHRSSYQDPSKDTVELNSIFRIPDFKRHSQKTKQQETHFLKLT